MRQANERSVSTRLEVVGRGQGELTSVFQSLLNFCLRLTIGGSAIRSGESLDTTELILLCL